MGAGSADDTSFMADAVGAIGTETFGSQLDVLVDHYCRIDFCACYRIASDRVDVVAMSDPNRFESATRIDTYANGKLWETDPALHQAFVGLESNSLSYARLRRTDIADHRLRDVVYTHLVDRLLVCYKNKAATYAISLLRWRSSAPFLYGDIESLLSRSPVIMALVDRHFVSSVKHGRPADAFASRELAEQCLRAVSGMPARECEVCARVIFGFSLPAIASDLGISVDTVKSYVKRAYQRIEIGSQRELVVAYLEYWEGWARSRILS
ncbi:helix-turn-helix transcriptional regulator [Cupriavidus metallidurans]|nr:LuxR C-terminal-related transcriptional regulator [Cupriavidus metallidurans]